MEGRARYRLLRSKGGVQGHVQALESGEKLSLSGLAPGKRCSIYYREEAGEWQQLEAKADGQGRIIQKFLRAGQCFITTGQKVIAWEDEGRGQENYLQACAVLARSVMRTENHSQEKKNAAPEMKAAIETERRPASLTAMGEKSSCEDLEDAPIYTLRAESSALPADNLPALQWPEKIRHLQVYFDQLPPIAPFDLPGWRFVRASSPVRECAYCILGIWTAEERVQRVIYGLPGQPFHPPAGLSGYRYASGKEGKGYWVTEESYQ